MTRTRSIWVHLVDEYIASKAFPPLLERPINMCTSEELERQLLVWISADLGWATDDGHAARERSLLVEPPEFIHLIKGGRWLLVTTNIGAVTYYDLNADNISGVLLIPAQVQDTCRHYKIMMSIDINRDSSVLSFKIGFFIIGIPFPQDSNPHSIGTKPMFQVWAVNLVLDDSRKAVGLRAARLAVFDLPFAFHGVLEFSFLGPYIAFIANTSGSFMHTIVFRWTQVVENTSNYYWRILNAVLSPVSIVHTWEIYIIFMDFVAVSYTASAGKKNFYCFRPIYQVI